MTHSLPIADFDAIAAGGGDGRIIRRLISAEYSRRLVLLYELFDVLTDGSGLLGPLPSVDEAWRLLQRIEDGSSAGLLEVLLSPQVGIWLTHTLRRMRNMTTGEAPLWVAAGHLYSVILAAAVRAGIDLSVQVPVRRGTVALPTLGLAHLGPAGGYQVADAVADRGGLVLRLGGRSLTVDRVDEPAPRWWNLRRLDLRSGARRLEMALDDIDPYRDLADPVEPGRLGEATVVAWRDRLADAWRIIEDSAAETADAMQAGFWSITPQPRAAAGEVRSASTGDAFGAALMSLPDDAATAAVTMVHEFQHNKLGALLHLVDLTAGAEQRPHLYAPWRPDPRPVSGLLQGVYAFLGITAFWRGLRTVGSTSDRRTADFEFALARRQTWAGLRALQHPGQLTAWGRRFAEGMAARLRPWLRERVPPGVDRDAWALFLDHRAGWRIRHLEVDPAWTSEAAAAWADGRDLPPAVTAPALVRTDRPVWPHHRLRQYRAAAAHDDDAVSAPGTQGDVMLLRGHAGSATREYLRDVARSPEDFDAWTGLGLAIAAQPGRREWRALLHRPELVKAVHDALGGGGARPSPVTVARWLTS